jgi:hypothetical protein
LCQSYIETFVPAIAPHLSKSRHTFQNRATPFKIAPHLSKTHRYAFLVQSDRIATAKVIS